VNFDWTEEQQKLRDAVEALLDDATLRDAEEMETAEPGRLEALTRKQLARLGEAGYLSVAQGAAGRAETLAWIAAGEVLARASGALYLAAESSARLCGGLVATHGTATQCSEILEGLRRGTLVGAVAASDAEDGDPATATLEGQEAVVQATKAYVTNGPLADWFAVVVRCDGQPAVALVERGARGLKRGERLDTLGYHGLAVAPLWLDKVRIPRDQLYGPFADNGPLTDLRRTENLVLASASVGLAARSFEAAKAHANRHQRGGKPLMGYQDVRFQLAEMLTLVQTAQLAAQRAGWLVTDVDGPDGREAGAMVRVAKVFCAESAEEVARSAMQILAGRGFMAGNPAERAYRDAKLAALAGTTSGVARMQIADELLERYEP
jgi:alkylation response protein AidB-like acyl-CoA dehydrogenase